MSILGPNLRDLGELWAGQDYVYQTGTSGTPQEPRAARFCNCIGYLTNPGGRCCMDLQDDARGKVTTTTATDKIVIGDIQPAVIAQGWQCPLCQTVHAPHVNSCNCRKNDKPFVINNGDGTVIRTFRPPHTSEMP